MRRIHIGTLTFSCCVVRDRARRAVLVDVVLAQWLAAIEVDELAAHIVADGAGLALRVHEQRGPVQDVRAVPALQGVR